jgi:hypothetical protein
VSTTGPVDLPHTFRPLGARIAAAMAAVVLIGMMTLLWLLMSQEVQETFTTFQRVTLVVVIAIMVLLLYALFRTSARADYDGLTIVNGFHRRRFAWAQIVRVSLSSNRPWALVDLDDGSTASVMAIQSSDGARARRAARELAALVEQRTGTERDD